jgi:DNA-binding FadR family transcriptional regulator
MTAPASAFDRALDQLGAAIVAGELPAGHTDTVDGFIARTGASRSVVREVTRVLGALGLLSAGRRVGLRILPLAQWDLLDPRVIRWRLEGPDREVQLAELRSLRHAVEPAAAAAAARAVRDGRRSTQPLDEALDAMVAAADGPESGAFLAADRAFHAAVLDLSGNAMLLRLREVIEEGLRHRALVERGELTPDRHDLALHREVAEAIGAGGEERAAAGMREIIERTSEAG